MTTNEVATATRLQGSPQSQDPAQTNNTPPRKEAATATQPSERQEDHQAGPLSSTGKSSIVVFNFEANWHLVKPHLKNRRLNAVLKREVNDYIEACRADCLEKGIDPTGWRMTYDPKNGPWFYGRSGSWECRVEDLAEAAVQRGEFVWRCSDDEEPSESDWERYCQFCEQFYPQPDTCQWYQMFGGCHWLAPWLRELGKLVFPEHLWQVMEGDLHSIAFGIHPTGHSVIFDILNFETMSAEEIIEFTKGRRVRPRNRR